MRYWLMKSEPDTFSIDDLKRRPRATEHWDGVRNYQARNFMRDMRKGDEAFFYHSSCEIPGVVGIVEVVREAYPDDSAWDPKSNYYDSKSRPDRPLWYMVDVRLKRRFEHPVPLSALRANGALSEMRVLKRGNRLSITPVSAREWRAILEMEQEQEKC